MSGISPVATRPAPLVLSLQALFVMKETSAARAAYSGVDIRASMSEAYAEVLTADALLFVAALERRFRRRRDDLLRRRVALQARLDDGCVPHFLDETQEVRDNEWTIAPLPADLEDRRVEIFWRARRVAEGLTSGANVVVVDLEDGLSPTFGNLVEAQLSIREAVHQRTEADPALMVRPRGWHMDDKHVLVDGRPVSASLLDFGLFFFHNASELVKQGSGPYCYLPKIECYLEARLWNDVFIYAQDTLALPRGTIKAAVLIENLLAAFEMDEILFELREHSAGLSLGRWDYIFSFIRKFRSRANCVFPDRSDVGADRHFLRSLSELLIKTCHRRGAHAVGGMAVQMPIPGDPERDAEAIEQVRQELRREVRAGHDGTRVAHPGLVALAREEIDTVIRSPRCDQIGVLLEDSEVGPEDLLRVPRGAITELGLRHNLSVAVLYLEGWLNGRGRRPLYGLMEDASTAEIARALLWQWVHHSAQLFDGRTIDPDLFKRILAEELSKIRAAVGSERYADGRYDLAASLLERMTLADELVDWMTVVGYEQL